MKKRQFYGLGNSQNEGGAVVLPPSPPVTDMELSTTRTTANVAQSKPIVLGQNMSFCGGMSTESLLLIGGVIALVGIVAHYSTR